MIIYNTTFHIANEVLEECLQYLKKTYMPQAASSGFLHNPCLRKVLHAAEQEEGCSYAVQFRVKNIDTLNYWMEREGGQLHKALSERFGSRVVGFSTLLEEIDWEA
ncbi:DUF4286 family protein [Parabacteroides sp. PF5-6]|uniref:DUF4286 family protein n=1 Tax=Parabacteroides sp. PF5-6 TaxID=1742403 RepID=UPI002405E0EE|nr:DUF4286 family protein [Parabacteroides sp. PF5-6]MDF9831333.1 hypothetical protein [Parabacteroides sp. PF5-6]